MVTTLEISQDQEATSEILPVESGVGDNVGDTVGFTDGNAVGKDEGAVGLEVGGKVGVPGNVLATVVAQRSLKLPQVVVPPFINPEPVLHDHPTAILYEDDEDDTLLQVYDGLVRKSEYPPHAWLVQEAVTVVQSVTVMH